MHPAVHPSWLVCGLSVIGLLLVLGMAAIVAVVFRRRENRVSGGSPPAPPVTMAMAPASSTADTKEARLDILRRLARKEIDKARAEQELARLGEPAMEIPNPPSPPPPANAAGGCLRGGLMGCLGCLVAVVAFVLLVILLGLGLRFCGGMTHPGWHGGVAMPPSPFVVSTFDIH